MSHVFAELAPALESLGAVHTVREILGQPDLWEAVFARLEVQRPELLAFLAEALADPAREVVLTGAGSSAFVGELVHGALARSMGRRVRPVATTDIVTHPEACFTPDCPVLLVSFARSGNSPESVAALDRAEAAVADLRHLVITCNGSGDLARHPTRQPKAMFVLPPESDDQGLAMTGSFTGMALAGLLLGDLGRMAGAQAQVRALARAGRALLAEGALFREAAASGFSRAVFLGSGPKKGAARESHLKLQELTGGAVMCAYDSFLGLRHGPKAAVDTETLMVYLFSAEAGVRRYEEDLVAELNAGVRGVYRLAVGGRLMAPAVDARVAADSGLDDDFGAVLAVLPAQILGVYRSLALGLEPDRPSPTGAISRVVQGVTIYPHP